MLNIFPVPAFHDNYLWLFHQQGESRACVVDPGDAEPILAALEKHQLTLAAILITHHHADHTGGIETLLQHYPVPVYGPRSQHIPQITDTVAEGDELVLLDTAFSIIEIPGHTLDHIAYFAQPEGAEPILFCGDTLFAGGCGRVFEGTYDMMYHSLQKLAALPADSRIFCAHEYTLANLDFALAVTPDDQPLQARVASEKAKRAQNIATVPSSIARELATNPFLRCDAASIRQALTKQGLPATEPVEVFAGIRAWKDRF